jgi:hypothetical protein
VRERLFEVGFEVVLSSRASGSHDLCVVVVVHGIQVVADMVSIAFLYDSNGDRLESVVVEYVGQTSRVILCYSTAGRMNSTVVGVGIAGVPSKNWSWQHPWPYASSCDFQTAPS